MIRMGTLTMFMTCAICTRQTSFTYVVSRSVNVCGVAQLNLGESSAEDEKRGFALTVSECGGLTFAHEFGHNMGLHHDRYAVGVPVTGSNYGYVNQRMFDEGAPESARWRTIMAYGRSVLRKLEISTAHGLHTSRALT